MKGTGNQWLLREGESIHSRSESLVRLPNTLSQVHKRNIQRVTYVHVCTLVCVWGVLACVPKIKEVIKKKHSWVREGIVRGTYRYLEQGEREG